MQPKAEAALACRYCTSSQPVHTVLEPSADVTQINPVSGLSLVKRHLASSRYGSLCRSGAVCPSSMA